MLGVELRERGGQALGLVREEALPPLLLGLAEAHLRRGELVGRAQPREAAQLELRRSGRDEAEVATIGELLGKSRLRPCAREEVALDLHLQRILARLVAQPLGGLRGQIAGQEEEEVEEVSAATGIGEVVRRWHLELL